MGEIWSGAWTIDILPSWMASSRIVLVIYLYLYCKTMGALQCQWKSIEFVMRNRKKLKCYGVGTGASMQPPFVKHWLLQLLCRVVDLYKVTIDVISDTVQGVLVRWQPRLTIICVTSELLTTLVLEVWWYIECFWLENCEMPILVYLTILTCVFLHFPGVL